MRRYALWTLIATLTVWAIASAVDLEVIRYTDPMRTGTDKINSNFTHVAQQSFGLGGNGATNLTNWAWGSNLVAYATGTNTNAIRYSIQLSNLALALGPHITNSGSGGGGGGGSLITNANQFGASTTLSIKTSAALTNIQHYGILESLGLLNGEGGIQIPGLTKSRVLVNNAAGDITNSTATATEAGYLAGVTSAIQTQLDALTAQDLVLGTNATATKLLVVDAVRGNDTTAVRGWNRPWQTLSNACVAVTNGDTILVLPGTNTVVAQTNVLMGGAILANVTNVTLQGYGFGSIVRATGIGTLLAIKNVENVRVSGIQFWGLRETNTSYAFGANGIFGSITISGAHNGVEVDHCFVNSGTDHGILVSSVGGGNSTNENRFHHNLIYNVGSFFPVIGFYDGAGIQMASGSATDNVIVDCGRGLELYGDDTAQQVVRHAVFARNKVIGCLDYGLITGYTNLASVHIEDNLFHNPQGYTRGTSNMLATGIGISISGLGVDGVCVIRRNEVNHFSDNIYVAPGSKGTRYLDVSDNVVRGARGTFGCGINLDAAARVIGPILVRGNTILDSAWAGLSMRGVTGALVTDNTIINAGTNTAQTGRGIYLRRTDANDGCSNVVVSSNLILDNQSTQTTEYGIDVQANVLASQIIGNRVGTMQTSAINNGSTGVSVWNFPSTNGLSGQVLTEDASGNLYWTTSSGSGEANVNGETSVTNATRIGLVAGKDGVTNLLRSLQGGANVTLTNQGTNIAIAATMTPAGSDTWVQFNSNGVLQANALLQYDHTAGTLNVGSSLIVTSVVLLATGNSYVQTPRVDITNSLRLFERDGGLDNVSLRAPVTLGANYTLTLPETNGLVGHVLTEDGSGGLSWSNTRETAMTTNTYGATLAVDLTANIVQKVTLTGHITLSTTGRSANRARSILLTLLANGADRHVTNSASWVVNGTNASYFTIPSGKTGLLSLTSVGSAETDVIAEYEVAQ